MQIFTFMIQFVAPSFQLWNWDANSAMKSTVSIFWSNTPAEAVNNLFTRQARVVIHLLHLVDPTELTSKFEFTCIDNTFLFAMYSEFHYEQVKNEAICCFVPLNRQTSAPRPMTTDYVNHCLCVANHLQVYLQIAQSQWPKTPRLRKVVPPICKILLNHFHTMHKWHFLPDLRNFNKNRM